MTTATPADDTASLKAQIAGSQKAFAKADVQAALRHAAPGIQTILLDSRYWAVSRATWDAMIAAYGPDRNKYVSERYDCDDFAFSFKGGMGHTYEVNGVGIVLNWGHAHAYNAILVNDGGKCVVEYLEPQNDQFVRTPAPALYQLTHGLIIL